jgi:hypothetical protein
MRWGVNLAGPELIAAVLGGCLSVIDGVIGLLAMPFAGSGPMGFIRVLSVTLGFELPVYIISFFISRRALMYACWFMYGLIHIEDTVFLLTEDSSPLNVFAVLRAFLATIVFSSEGIVTLVIALLATYLFREERETLARNSET